VGPIIVKKNRLLTKKMVTRGKGGVNEKKKKGGHQDGSTGELKANKEKVGREHRGLKRHRPK